jgi:hypothetical protein
MYGSGGFVLFPRPRPRPRSRSGPYIFFFPFLFSVVSFGEGGEQKVGNAKDMEGTLNRMG